MTTPKDHISTFELKGRPKNTSGAVYSHVPAPSLHLVPCVARPKSASLIQDSVGLIPRSRSATKIFSGLMSRWMTGFGLACKLASPRRHCVRMLRIWLGCHIGRSFVTHGRARLPLVMGERSVYSPRHTRPSRKKRNSLQTYIYLYLYLSGVERGQRIFATLNRRFMTQIRQ